MTLTAPPAPPVPRALPLTQAQLGLWAEEREQPGGTLNHVAETLDLRGPLDPARLRAALSDTLREVPALHVRFRDDGQRVRQLLGPVTPRAPQEHDLSGHPDPDARAQAITGALLDAPLDLPGGELYRHALLRLGPDHLRWVFVTHHIALDGYGMHLLLGRLAAGYRQEACAPFDPLDAAVLEDGAYQASPDRARDRAALNAVYADLPFEPAPLLTRGLKRGWRAGRDLPPTLVRDLRAGAGPLKIGWPDLLFALSAAFWHAHTGERATLIAAPVMLRLGSAAARVPCMIMNLLPLRVNVAPHDSLRTLTTQVREARTRAQPHARYRYEHLWADLRGRRLFGPEVNVLPFAAPPDLGPGLRVTARTLASGPVEDLALTFSGWAGALHLSVDGHPDLYTPAQVGGLCDRLIRGLDLALRDPDAPLPPLLREHT